MLTQAANSDWQAARFTLGRLNQKAGNLSAAAHWFESSFAQGAMMARAEVEEELGNLPSSPPVTYLQGKMGSSYQGECILWPQ